MGRAFILVGLLVVTLVLAACSPPTSTPPPGVPAPPTPTPPSMAAPSPTPSEAPAAADTATPGPDRSTGESPLTGRIAFQTDRDGNHEIYVMSADGSDPVNLTNHRANDSSPAWSPDGTRIAFVSDRDANLELYVMDADGSNVTRLTKTDDSERGPAWSPDGTRLAFGTGPDRSFEIYVMEIPEGEPARERDQEQLTETDAFSSDPDWSPDGQWIAFYTEEQHYAGPLQMVRPDGTDLTRLTGGSSWHDFGPAWSPDGTRIAFSSEKDAHLRLELYVLDVPQVPDDAPVTSATRLTTFKEQVWYPDWSPDGVWIAFGADPGGDNTDIYALKPGDGEPGSHFLVRLTHDPGIDSHPSWAP